MGYSPEHLELSETRFIEMEKVICELQENVMTLSEQLRETQRYLIKLAHAQAEVTKRVSLWPFIAVNTRNE